MREKCAAVLLGLSVLLVVVGVVLIWVPAGWIVGGFLLAGWTWLVFGDDSLVVDEDDVE